MGVLKPRLTESQRRANRAAEVGLLKLRPIEVRLVERTTRKTSGREQRHHRHGFRQISAAEVAFREIGAVKIRFPQLGGGEVGLGKHHSGCIAATQIGLSKRRTLRGALAEARSVQIRAIELGAGQIDPHQPSARELGAAEITITQVDLRQRPVG